MKVKIIDARGKPWNNFRWDGSKWLDYTGAPLDPFADGADDSLRKALDQIKQACEGDKFNPMAAV